MYSKDSVCHYIPNYLGLSETFIYQIINNHQDFIPIVIAQKTQNLEKFPLKKIISSGSLKKYSYWWLRNHLDYDFMNKDVFFENISFFKWHIKKTKPRIIHAHFGPSGYEILPIKKSLKLPLVTTFYGYDMSQLPKQKEWQEKYKKLFDEGDIFLVEGPYMKQKLSELGCSEAKIKTQKISIDLDKISFREGKLKKDTTIKLLFCGRFVEKKGLIYALQALKKITNTIKNIEFRIIGDGKLKNQIVDYMEKNHLAKHITLLGYQTYEKMLEEIQHCHILIQPSITAENGDSEGGAPTILLEAQASGMPVISTFHADIPEVVLNNQSGLLCEEKNVDQLTSAILYLVNNPDLSQKFGKTGREFVDKNHNIHTNIIHLEKLYRELI